MAKLGLEVVTSEGVAQGVDVMVEDAIEAAMIAGARFAAGQHPNAPGKRSPIGRHFVKTNRERYQWKALNKKYAKWKQKKFGKLPILVRTGRLRDEMLDEEHQQIKFNRKTGTATIAFNVVDYAKWHQHGGTTPGRPPKRPPASFNKEDVGKVTGLVADVLKDQFAGTAGVGVRRLDLQAPRKRRT